MATKRIVNVTKHAVLAEKAEVADTPSKRTKGLLGKNGLREGEGMLIKPCSSIHTFFMKFNIDVVFLGKGSRVVSLTESLPPSRLFGSLFKGKMVIELPPGTIAKTHTSIGDEIEVR